jgi:DNA repair photolyase
MSPVLSPTAPAVGIRRRHVRQSSATLFPIYPDATSPKPGAESQRKAHPNTVQVFGGAGSSGSNLGCPTADCPPPTSLEATSALTKPMPTAACGPQNHTFGRTREAAAPLVGIARLAASSPPAETRRKSVERPEYFLLPVKSILNRCDSERVPFEWTINPYRGCEFGCKYCYARYTHEYMELDGGEFENKIFVKKDAAPLLAYDIAHKYSYGSRSSEGDRPEHIAIGTATDPYQPAEREHGVTRASLEELAKREGLSVSVITKSNQIVRDIDLFKQIAARSALSLNVTVTTLRTKLARLLEPRAPRPDLRLAAVRQLREAGLAVGVSAAPLIPGITDRQGELEAVAEAAREAGAMWFWSGVLFLMPSSAKQFVPFIREKFPHLADQYERWYRKNGYAPEEYRKKAAERVARIRKKFGFMARPGYELERAMPRAQLSLGWDAAAVSAEMQRTRSCTAG